MTPDEELTLLRAKLEASARYGNGYKDRIAAINARIAEIEADNSDDSED